MRKLLLKMSLSIDGFVAGRDGKTDWIFKNSDEASRAWSVENSWEAGLIIMGRKSFETMGPYWPTATGPFAAPMNEIPKAVFTKKGFKGLDLSDVEPSPAKSSWMNARIFDGNLAEEISTLKSESGKPIAAIGGAEFARNLIATGLIDTYHLVIHPLVLGQGLPIFNSISQTIALKLAEVKTFPGGIVAHTYHAS